MTKLLTGARPQMYKRALYPTICRVRHNRHNSQLSLIMQPLCWFWYSPERCPQGTTGPYIHHDEAGKIPWSFFISTGFCPLEGSLRQGQAVSNRHDLASFSWVDAEEPTIAIPGQTQSIASAARSLCVYPRQDPQGTQRRPTNRHMNRCSKHLRS